jgi:FkbM family methyltransferase
MLFMDVINNNFNIVILLICVIVLFFIFNRENFVDLSDFVYYDENNNKINNLELEIDEQLMAIEYVEPSDIVLELGARYGTVSVVVSKIVENKGKLVAVEPDPSVQKSLLNNKIKNNANFEILNKLISNKPKKLVFNGYGTYMVDTNTNDGSYVTYNDFKKLYPYNFNVLIVDCEGCLNEFIDMLGSDLNNYNKIMFEADQPHLCDYDNVINKLTDNGFTLVDKRFNEVYRYYFKRL